jgi:hypothetical protein
LVVLDGTKRPYPLRFHVKEAAADAKLIQHGPLGVANHCRHPISAVPVDVYNFISKIYYNNLLFEKPDLKNNEIKIV